MYLQTPKIEAGHVWLPRSAPWLETFKDEVCRFPGGRYDDQVDSLSQYLGWATSRPVEPGDFIIEPRVSAVIEALGEPMSSSEIFDALGVRWG